MSSVNSRPFCLGLNVPWLQLLKKPEDSHSRSVIFVQLFVEGAAIFSTKDNATFSN